MAPARRPRADRYDDAVNEPAPTEVAGGGAGSSNASPAGSPSASGAEQSTSTTRTGLALLVIVTGVLITAVDTTIVVLALPEIQRALHVGIASVIWVIIANAILSWLIAFDVVNMRNRIVRSIVTFLDAVTRPILRPLRRVIQRSVGDPLAVALLEGRFSDGDSVHMGVAENGEALVLS